MKRLVLVRIIKCFILFIALFGTYKALNYIVTDDSTVTTRITFHDFYEADSVDILFLGASHVYHGLNMEQLSSLTGKECYSVSTAAQKSIGSYYILKETLDLYDIDEVYYEISPIILSEQFEDIKTTNLYIITDYLKYRIGKLSDMFKIYGADGFINGAFQLRRNFNILSDTPVDWSTPTKKDNTYKQYDSPSDRYVYTYLGRGSWGLNDSRAENPIVINTDVYQDNIKVSDIGSEEWHYLQKIVSLCNKKGVKLTFFVMPYSDYYLTQYTEYTNFTNYIRQYASDNNVGWLDFNLASADNLSLDDTNFLDTDHLNISGNSITTQFLSEYVSGQATDCFYENIEEKWSNEPLPSSIFGIECCESYFDKDGDVAGSLDFDGYVSYLFSVIGNQDCDIELKVCDYSNGPYNESEGTPSYQVNEIDANTFSVQQNGQDYYSGLWIGVYEKGTDNCLYWAKKME